MEVKKYQYYAGGVWRDAEGGRIVVGGPFVMNSRKEIAQAYGDFFAGRYGEMSNVF